MPNKDSLRELKCSPSIVFTPRKLSVHRHATEGNDADQAPIEKQPQTQQSSATIARGQTTAIVTGAISIIFGVAYLALVQFMDMRGGELLPPPPEAFME